MESIFSLLLLPPRRLRLSNFLVVNEQKGNGLTPPSIEYHLTFVLSLNSLLECRYMVHWLYGLCATCWLARYRGTARTWLSLRAPSPQVMSELVNQRVMHNAWRDVARTRCIFGSASWIRWFGHGYFQSCFYIWSDVASEKLTAKIDSRYPRMCKSESGSF